MEERKMPPKEAAARGSEKGLATRLRNMERRREAFLEAFATHGTIRAACRSIGIGRETVTRWREEDAKFDARFEDMKLDLGEGLEEISLREARKPANFPERKFILQALLPEKYREKQRIEVSSPEALRVIMTDDGPRGTDDAPPRAHQA